MFFGKSQSASNEAQHGTRRSAVVLSVVTLGAVVVGDANAASVIDAAMKTALESGFADLIDTVKDVIATSWPFVIGAAVLMAAPGLVLKLIGKATGGR